MELSQDQGVKSHDFFFNQGIVLRAQLEDNLGYFAIQLFIQVVFEAFVIMQS